MYFRYSAQAVQIIEKDMMGDSLEPTVKIHYERVYTNHRPESVKPLFQKLYEKVEEVPNSTLPKEIALKRGAL